MASRPPPPENVPKDEESESGAMDRFRSLAKGLFGVSRTDYADAEERERHERAARVTPCGPRSKPG